MISPPKLFDLILAPKAPEELPHPDNPYYVAAKQGLYLHKTSPLGVALIPTRTLPPNLNPLPTAIENGLFTFSAPKLPPSLMADTLVFFKEVHDKHKAEAEVIILFNPAPSAETYRLFVPFQRVTGGSVHSIYDPTTLPTGYQAIGSIHSHCNMGAFHSGTDTGDATVFPGLHITIGTLDAKDGASYAAMVMFNGVRFDFDINTVATTIAGDYKGEVPRAWHERIITASEGDRAKVIADTMKNVSEDDKKKFLSVWAPTTKTTWGKPTGSIQRDWNEVWDEAQTTWWARTDKDKTVKDKKHKRGGSMRWHRELGMSFDADLIDNDGDFPTVDAAMEAISIVMDRVTRVAADYDLEVGFEIIDAQTGNVLMWNTNEPEAEEPKTASQVKP